MTHGTFPSTGALLECASCGLQFDSRRALELHGGESHALAVEAAAPGTP